MTERVETSAELLAQALSDLDVFDERIDNEIKNPVAQDNLHYEVKDLRNILTEIYDIEGPKK